MSAKCNCKVAIAQLPEAKENVRSGETKRREQDELA
jgi:hypothetical protein